MLAEIFFLRLEATSRASEEAAQAGNSRFVPVPRTVLSDFRKRQARGLKLRLLCARGQRPAPRPRRSQTL